MVICKEILSRYSHDGVAGKLENNMCYTSRLLVPIFQVLIPVLHFPPLMEAVPMMSFLR